jgi:hypothetical protein
MTAPDITDCIRHHLDALAAACATGAEALDGASLDLPEGTLAQLLGKLEGLAGRLDLVLDRLGAALDPVRVAG